MSLGLGIFLFVVGAILAFAVDVQLSGLDLKMIGYILMGAGIIVIIIGVALLARGRTSVSETRTSIDPATGSRVTRSARNDDPPIV
jgi:membrane-bound ClpP family serine protease